MARIPPSALMIKTAARVESIREGTDGPNFSNVFLGSMFCSHCGGRLRILSAIIPLDAIVKILECLGRPSKPPPILPAEPDRDPEFFIN
jgi:hypothetical protein